MKKVLILLGSPRKNGTTKELTKWVTQGISSNPDVSIEIVDVARLNFKVNGCSSCYGCRAIRFNSMQPNYLEVYDTREEEAPIGGRRGFVAIETVQRYPKPALQFPGPKFSIGWIRNHIGNAMDFITNVEEDKKPLADMYAGYKVQEVMEAALISDKEKRWVELPIKF